MCSCPGDCEGGPECLDGEGGPLPTMSPRLPVRGGIHIYWGQPHVLHALAVPPHLWPLVEGRSLLAGAATVRESGTGGADRLLPFVTRVVIPGAAPDDVYTADVTTWVDEEGEPAGEGGEPALRNGEPVTVTFRYILGFGGTDSPDPFADKAAQQ